MLHFCAVKVTAPSKLLLSTKQVKNEMSWTIINVLHRLIWIVLKMSVIISREPKVMSYMCCCDIFNKQWSKLLHQRNPRMFEIGYMITKIVSGYIFVNLLINKLTISVGKIWNHLNFWCHMCERAHMTNVCIISGGVISLTQTRHPSFNDTDGEEM